jgi:hypothetical protein
VGFYCRVLLRPSMRSSVPSQPKLPSLIIYAAIITIAVVLDGKHVYDLSKIWLSYILCKYTLTYITGWLVIIYYPWDSSHGPRNYGII